MKTKVIKKAKTYDYRNYDPARCRNGGWYGFWTTYELSNESELRIGLDTEPLYAVSYGTTAEFSYCEYCGSWGGSSCSCGKTPEYITEKRLLADMRIVEEDPSPDRWIKVLEEVEITPSADWVNIRRRCEDALRICKDDRTIFNAANLLGVKIEEEGNKMKTIRVESLEHEHHVPELMGQDVVVSAEIVAAACAEEDRLRAMAIRETARETEEARVGWERRIKKIVRERHVSRDEAIARIGPAPDYAVWQTFHWTTIALMMHTGGYDVRRDRRGGTK